MSFQRKINVYTLRQLLQRAQNVNSSVCGSAGAMLELLSSFNCARKKKKSGNSVLFKRDKF